MNTEMSTCLLGKAEDVTSRRAAAEHFRQLAARHRRQAKSALASARLDSTANQTLDAKAASRYLLRTLFRPHGRRLSPADGRRRAGFSGTAAV